MKFFAIGESLIDFYRHKDCFIPFVGGAPANVAACFSKLGGRAYFIGKTGDDLFGDIIIETLKNSNVDTEFLTKTRDANTALSFVSLTADGERSFLFYRNPSADIFLSENDIRKICFAENDILHFGSVGLIEKPLRETTAYAIKKIKSSGGTVSFDPNVRQNLCRNIDVYRKIILNFIEYADIIKISSEECEFLYKSRDYDAVAETLLYKAHTVLFTFGKDGSSCYTRSGSYRQKAFPIDCKDTTGAGDSFIGSFLRYFIRDEEEAIKASLIKASACSAIVCSKKGVIDSLPDEEALNAFISLYDC